MRKRKKGKKLKRPRDARKALLISLARELLLKEKIKTTEIKAKELRSFVEKHISRARQSFVEQNLGGRAKINQLSSKRLLAKIFSWQVVKKLFDEIVPRYKERKGGYTRLIKLGPRKSDGAKMAIIELVK